MRLEHGLDAVRRAEHPLDLRASASGADYGEVAHAGISEAAPVDHDRDAGNEGRVADDELASAPDLDDEQLARGLGVIG